MVYMPRQYSDEYKKEILDREINRLREYFTEEELKDKDKFKQLYLTRFSTPRGKNFLNVVDGDSFYNYVQEHGTQGGFYDKYGHRIIRKIHPSDATYHFVYAKGTIVNGVAVGGQVVKDIEDRLPKSFLEEHKILRTRIGNKYVYRHPKGTVIDGKKVGGQFMRPAFKLPVAIMQKYRLDRFNQPIKTIKVRIKGKLQNSHRYRKGAVRNGVKVGGGL
ncbi:hypothetical protein DRN76_03080 [Methanosarcinales archaeon]|nr:MAG: hypothetical protein DRN76_03080 [Methanosarcinales archaeon]